MSRTRVGASQRRSVPADRVSEAVGLELAPDRHAEALRFVFDRPVPVYGESGWWEHAHHVPLPLSPLEWTRFQTTLFANGRFDLAPFSDEQVGLGLRYLVDDIVCDVSRAVIEPSVSSHEAMRMMAAMPTSWREVFGVRRAGVHEPIGSSTDRLGGICYMWFDVWPTLRRVRDDPAWRDALWNVFEQMLAVPCRDVQVAALHGIGHHGSDLDRQPLMARAIADVVRTLNGRDDELAAYAEAARLGRVQ